VGPHPLSSFRIPSGSLQPRGHIRTWYHQSGFALVENFNLRYFNYEQKRPMHFLNASNMIWNFQVVAGDNDCVISKTKSCANKSTQKKCSFLLAPSMYQHFVQQWKCQTRFFLFMIHVCQTSPSAIENNELLRSSANSLKHQFCNRSLQTKCANLIKNVHVSAHQSD
jgi:hypothetical protein